MQSVSGSIALCSGTAPWSNASIELTHSVVRTQKTMMLRCRTKESSSSGQSCWCPACTLPPPARKYGSLPTPSAPSPCPFRPNDPELPAAVHHAHQVELPDLSTAARLTGPASSTAHSQTPWHLAHRSPPGCPRPSSPTFPASDVSSAACRPAYTRPQSCRSSASQKLLYPSLSTVPACPCATSVVHAPVAHAAPRVVHKPHGVSAKSGHRRSIRVASGPASGPSPVPVTR